MARKRGMQYIPYDYEAAYNKAMEDMHEWFIENLFQHRKKVIYALKEITAGDQFEIEIYPQFRSMDEVPPEGRTIKKDNNKAQKNLNDKNARKYVERLINENFSDRDIWMTLTYDDEHLPLDGDVDVPNGGSRNKQEAVKFKQMGVKAGVSDLCLPYPKGSYCGLFVEMKFGNNRQQDTQKEFLADMAAAGHFVATCYSAEEAIKVIEEYLNLSDALHMERNLNMSIPNNSILKDGKVKGGRS